MTSQETTIENRTIIAHEVRLMRRDEFETARRMIDAAMRPNETISAADDLPLLVGKNARSRRFVVTNEAGEILSHAAWRKLEFRDAGDRPLVLANIGAVATAAAARHRGLARAVMTEVLTDARREGADGAILWSDLDGFYEPFGFAAVGCEVRFLVSRDRLPRTSDIAVRPLEHADVARLRTLRRSDPMPATRSFDEAMTLFSLPETYTFVAEKDGKIIGYAVIGKGVDMKNVVHEWAGAPTTLIALLRSILLARGLDRTLCIGPGFRTDWIDALAPLADARTDCPIARIALFDPAAQKIDATQVLPPAALRCIFGSPGGPPPTLPFYVHGLDSM
jgi:predicted N-acetyltransferase YhbS